jgi:hypothetical protein
MRMNARIISMGCVEIRARSEGLFKRTKRNYKVNYAEGSRPRLFLAGTALLGVAGGIAPFASKIGTEK